MRDPLATKSSASFTYKLLNLAHSSYYLSKLKEQVIDDTLTLRVSTSDLRTLLFVPALRNCCVASMSCLYSVELSPFKESTLKKTRGHHQNITLEIKSSNKLFVNRT